MTIKVSCCTNGDKIDVLPIKLSQTFSVCIYEFPECLFLMSTLSAANPEVIIKDFNNTCVIRRCNTSNPDKDVDGEREEAKQQNLMYYSKLPKSFDIKHQKKYCSHYLV